MQGTIKVDCTGSKSEVQSLARSVSDADLKVNCSRSQNCNGDWQLTARIQSPAAETEFKRRLKALDVGYDDDSCFTFEPYASQEVRRKGGLKR